MDHGIIGEKNELAINHHMFANMKIQILTDIWQTYANIGNTIKIQLPICVDLGES